MENIIIRKLAKKEIPILERFLYLAIFQPDENHLLPRSVIFTPEIYVYIDNFGAGSDDICLLAEDNELIVACAWTRILNKPIRGYGNIDDTTPEFAIAVLPEYRKRGIGKQLMTALLHVLKVQGYKQASLSVDKNNHAVRMYSDLGFEIVENRETDYLMAIVV